MKELQEENAPSSAKAHARSIAKMCTPNDTRQLKKTSNLKAIVPVTGQKGMIETRQQILEFTSSSEREEIESIKQVQISRRNDSSDITFRFLDTKLVKESKY